MAIARQPFRSLAVAACVGFGAFLGDASAAVTTLSGYLNDSTNTALVASDGTTAQFADDLYIANNVALYAISVPVAGLVSFDSTGFAAGGVDPYFTLFSSSGGVLGSNYDQAFSTGGDFNLQYSLAAGSYTVALGAYANMSFAENWGTGTLADGFIGLGEPYLLGTSFYELTVTVPDQGGGTVPEPSSLLLVLMGLTAFAFFRRGAADACWRSAALRDRAFGTTRRWIQIS